MGRSAATTFGLTFFAGFEDPACEALEESKIELRLV